MEFLEFVMLFIAVLLILFKPEKEKLALSAGLPWSLCMWATFRPPFSACPTFKEECK